MRDLVSRKQVLIWLMLDCTIKSSEKTGWNKNMGKSYAVCICLVLVHKKICYFLSFSFYCNLLCFALNSVIKQMHCCGETMSMRNDHFLIGIFRFPHILDILWREPGQFPISIFSTSHCMKNIQKEKKLIQNITHALQSIETTIS